MHMEFTGFSLRNAGIGLVSMGGTGFTADFD